MINYHETVMADEAIEGLHIEKSRYYIDATLGTGGHTIKILKAGGNVLGIDMDPAMVEIAQGRVAKEKGITGNYKLVRGSFVFIDSIAGEYNVSQVWGVLFDLGVSNLHLKSMERGFSFENPEAELDMRIDPGTEAIKASDMLNALREDQLREMFEVTLEPGAARWLTGKVLEARDTKKFEKVGDFLEVCRGLKNSKKGLHEATLPFLALRMAVNSELENIKEALPKAFDLLVAGGRLVLMSFHSGEDAIVKNFFKEMVETKKAHEILGKPLSAGEAEIESNKRARSAKLRIIEKI